jgi:hypothetical protein
MAQTPNMGPRANARSGGFNALASGGKTYNGARSSPNLGPTSNLQGYRERNLTIDARKQAIIRRLKSQFGGVPLG